MEKHLSVRDKQGLFICGYQVHRHLLAALNSWQAQEECEAEVKDPLMTEADSQQNLCARIERRTAATVPTDWPVKTKLIREPRLSHFWHAPRRKKPYPPRSHDNRTNKCWTNVFASSELVKSSQAGSITLGLFQNSAHFLWLSRIFDRNHPPQSASESFTLRGSIRASCWQHCWQLGWSLVRLNSPSRSHEGHSRLLEKPSSLQASDDSSEP